MLTKVIERIEEEGLDPYVISKIGNNDNAKIVLRFPNGYGISIIYNIFSYGYEDSLLELAILEYNDENANIASKAPMIKNYNQDVFGYLSLDKLMELIHIVKTYGERRPITPEEFYEDILGG